MSDLVPAAPRQNNAGTYTNTLTGEVTYVRGITLVPSTTVTYAPRGTYTGEDDVIQYRDNLTGVPLSQAEIEYTKTGIDIRQTANQFINVTYRPEYFHLAAKDYKGTDKEARKAFLIDQIKKLEQSLGQYQVEAIAVQRLAAGYDGQSDVAKWAVVLGTVAISTKDPIAMAGGAVALAMGTVLKWVKAKADATKLEPLAYRAQLIQAEVAVIGEYYEKYTRELKGFPGLIIALAVGALIMNKK